MAARKKPDPGPPLTTAVRPDADTQPGQTLFTLSQAAEVGSLVGALRQARRELDLTRGWDEERLRHQPTGAGLPPEFAAALRRLRAELDAVLALSGPAPVGPGHPLANRG